MKKQLYLSLVIIFACSALMTGCMKTQSFPDTPEISFLNLELLYDTAQVVRTGILSISYQDGNGDIGLAPSDTFPPFQRGGPYYYNYVMTYFEKQNGVFNKVDLLIPFSLRIPVLNPNFPNKPIKGYIVDTIILYPPPLHDTIKFEAYIYDRALNKSNVVTTPEIVLKRK